MTKLSDLALARRNRCGDQAICELIEGSRNLFQVRATRTPTPAFTASDTRLYEVPDQNLK